MPHRDRTESSPFAAVQARLRQAAALTGLGLLAAAPYLHYMTAVAPRRVAAAGAAAAVRDPRAVLTDDFLLLLPLLAICSLVGCFLSRRYRLGGIGSRAQLSEALPWVVPAGVALGLASYLLLGRHFALEVPGTYPVEVGWALALAVKAALVDETVARFGMMTVLAGLTRRPWLANLLQALFFAALSVKAFAFHGIAPQPLVWASLAGTLAVNLSLGAAYARHGLAAAALMHLLVDLRLVLHACLA